MSMTGTCPMCNYSAPVQNSFKPNVMSEYYIPKTKEIVVLNDNEEELEHPTKGKMIRKDVHLKRQSAPQTVQTPTAPVKTNTPPPPATIAAKPAVIAARPIPASAIKTPDEIAATPKSATVATPVVETPLVANIVPSTEGQP